MLEEKSYGLDKGVSTSFIPSATAFTEYYRQELQNGFEAADVLQETGTSQTLPIGIILRPTGKLETSRADAIMGLGTLGNSLPNTFTQQFLQRTGSQIVNIYMNSFTYTNGQFQSSGGIVFGSVNTNKCDVNYYYQHLDFQNNWVVKIGHVMLGYDNVRGGSALIEPNAKYIYGPTPAIKILYRQLRAQKGNKDEYLVECSRVNSFPPLKITIHAHDHIIKPSEYIVTSSDGSKCVLLIRKKNNKEFKGFDWVLGLPILRGNCLLFDYVKKRIGFSKLS